MSLTLFKKLCLGIAVLVISHGSLYSQINFTTQSEFSYLKGIDASNIPNNWFASDFDYSTWDISNAPFRYGDGAGGTELTDMQGSYSTVFLRSKFTVQQLEVLGKVTIGADWDDGFILWINGKQVLGQQVPATVAYDALASDLHESGVMENFRFDASELGLIDGENTIAVLACNISLDGSSDFFFDMSISAFPELPELTDSLGITFSHESGFYESNFNLSLNTPVDGASVVYTLDGSNPQTSATRITKSNVASIAINPSSVEGRSTTPAVVVRASIVKDGYKPSKPESRTFIYIHKVLTQTNPGGSWPDENLSDRDYQYIDYVMDPEVVNSTQYKSKMVDAMLDIPSISIITDNANLFDPGYGIYMNAEGQGLEWERECSVELLNPDKSQGFNVNAGLRIRGGWSRHNDFPKHSFRLFFRSEYGNSKLEYPLFGDEGVDRYDKIDLRTAQNYSWANGASKYNTFCREVYTRDSQRDAGQPYTRSRYYHLYLNGMYWGMYQTQERSEARFASDYFGGKTDEYDVIKISGENYSKELVATDGTMDKWKEIYEFTQKGFTSNVDYYKLEGKDEKGKVVQGAEVYVDIDNLIDYMLNIIFTGNYDSPVSAWGGNKNPNNMYAITNREDKTFGFKFFIHDGEHAVMNEATQGPGIGLYENRANIGDISGDNQMLVTEFNRFHTQWLHYKLTKNTEYKIRFANRAWNQLTGKGIFTNERNAERLTKRATEIDLAIIAESARWGDTRRESPFTRDNEWENEINTIREDYFPFRTSIVIDQLEDLGLFPKIKAPVITESGSEIFESIFNLTSATNITISNPVSSGNIYYTLDGSDPRVVGGGVSSKAIKIISGESLNIASSAIVTARILNNDKWSAAKEITFIAKQTDYSNFKITEIHYHPLDSINGVDTISGKSYEFVEFRNTSKTDAINLSDLVIDSAIYFEFPRNYILAPQAYFVVAAKPSKFYDRYGLVASGNSSNSLSNGGERFVVYKKGGQVVMDFVYDDSAPWPILADGEGYSMESAVANPTGDPADFNYWTASERIGGSPFGIGTKEGTDVPNDISFDQLLSVYPNPTNDIFNVQVNNNDELNSLKIFDVKGAVYYQESFYESTSVSLENMNIGFGIYLVEIQSAKGKATKKLIYTP